jgi:hypothetical protein
VRTGEMLWVFFWVAMLIDSAWKHQAGWTAMCAFWIVFHVVNHKLLKRICLP